MTSKKLDLDTLVVKVERGGQTIRLPTKPRLDYTEAAYLLKRMSAEDEQLAVVHETVEGAIPDAALAVGTALKTHFGYVASGRGGQVAVTVPSGPGPEDTVTIPWGKCMIPSLDGREYVALVTLDTARGPEGGLILGCKLEGPRKSIPALQAAITDARKLLRENSLYRGNALSYNGERSTLHEIRFMDLPDTPPVVILRSETEAEINALVDTFLKEGERYIASGGSPRRSVLLAGRYGVGKTETARRLAHLARQVGQTFFYVESVHELPEVLRIARFYTPAIVFAEDAEQIMLEHDSLAEAMDGIDTKHQRLTMILTTNHPDKIHPVYLRPGRLDAVIYFDLPDAEAASRLLRHYGARESDVLSTAQLGEAGSILEGMSPAVIRESVQRGFLAGLVRDSDELTGEALLIAARSVRTQQERVDAERKEPEPVGLEKILESMVNKAVNKASHGHSHGINMAASSSGEAARNTNRLILGNEQLQTVMGQVHSSLEELVAVAKKGKRR